MSGDAGIGRLRLSDAAVEAIVAEAVARARETILGEVADALGGAVGADGLTGLEVAAGAVRALLATPAATGPGPELVAPALPACGSRPSAMGLPCDGAGAVFDVVYTTRDGREVDRGAACVVHGRAEMARHQAAGGIARVRLSGPVLGRG